MPETAVIESEIQGLELLARGKVRDIYAVDEQLLAIVATDRLSAYDVILPDPIQSNQCRETAVSQIPLPGIGTRCAHHLTALSLTDVAGDSAANRALNPRTMIVQRLAPLPVEAVVRGYLIGSGWRDYQDTGEVCGIRLPAGLVQAAALPEPLFTPATKAAVGDHDENISYADVVALVGEEVAAEVRATSMMLYTEGAAFARERGIIIADTKFEFGLAKDGRVVLIDEVLTPDSSRFWPADEYVPGGSPPSFDKQFVRDYLETLDWDKRPPGPLLPAAVLEGSAARYAEAVRRLTGPGFLASPK